MMGSIIRRGKSSWRLKFDGNPDPLTGERKTNYVTFQGRRSDAQAELARLVAAVHAGTHVEPSKITVASYIQSWLQGIRTEVSGKTFERYEDICRDQIIPHLGQVILQRLRPSQVATWHKILIERGGKSGKPLSAQTVKHCHRCLHQALASAVRSELISRNVCQSIKPPRIPHREITALTSGQMAQVLKALEAHPLLPIVTLALGSGARRGELLGLAWSDIDFSAGTVWVRRSLEETKAGLKFKAPKTKVWPAGDRGTGERP